LASRTSFNPDDEERVEAVDDSAELIRSWFVGALRAVEPERRVRWNLEGGGQQITVGDHVVPVRGKILLAAVGKAACGMARGAQAALGERIAGGVVITKDGHVDGPVAPPLMIFEAAHPIPDERGVAATQSLLALVGGATEDDLVLALISGGGSALMEAPRPPVTLDDMARTTDLLLRAGAPIGDLNAVRVPLSLVKGGGLRRAGRRARFATLLLSDVLGNDPAVIASGPTVGSSATAASALRILEKYDLTGRVPDSVGVVLTRESELTPVPIPPGEPVVVVGDNALAVTEMRRLAQRSGRRASMLWNFKEGEASTLGARWVTECQRAPAEVDVLLAGGEATVTVRGDGVGGRNTEFALAAAISMAERGVDDWIVASLATDGQDGPTGAAGAIADGGTVTRAARAGVDASAALANNDSLRVFDAAGGTVITGPTGTNVNDLYVAVRRR
jgi:glycerate 2-kinase